jgi:SP family general alpha glucoside:H+ symporter-like MFS transporter
VLIHHRGWHVDGQCIRALGLITSALQMVFVMLSWILTTYFGRRSIYLWGSAGNTILLVALGVAASVGVSKAATQAQASLGLIVSVLFTLGPAPASWVIIGETSAIRLRPLTTGIGRATYYIVEIPCIFRKFPTLAGFVDMLTWV